MGEELYSAQKGKKNLELFGIDSATGFSAESCSHTARGRRKATLTRGPQPSAKERREREGSGARGPPGAGLACRPASWAGRGEDTGRAVGFAGEEKGWGAGPRGERGGSAGVSFFSFLFSFPNPFPNKKILNADKIKQKATTQN